MSETTNLKLFKHDNPSTNTNPFDVEQSLNDNWDKIDTAAGEIQEEQKEELDTLARTNAKAENSYAPIQEQINKIYEKIDNLEARLNKIEGTEEPIETIEEYPEYVQPTGAHDCYNTGDKITYNGKKYVCKINGCVWDPETYPAGWQEVVEENIEESEDNK